MSILFFNTPLIYIRVFFKREPSSSRVESAQPGVFEASKVVGVDQLFLKIFIIIRAEKNQSRRIFSSSILPCQFRISFAFRLGGQRTGGGGGGYFLSALMGCVPSCYLGSSPSAFVHRPCFLKYLRIIFLSSRSTIIHLPRLGSQWRYVITLESTSYRLYPSLISFRQ